MYKLWRQSPYIELTLAWSFYKPFEIFTVNLRKIIGASQKWLKGKPKANQLRTCACKMSLKPIYRSSYLSSYWVIHIISNHFKSFQIISNHFKSPILRGQIPNELREFSQDPGSGAWGQSRTGCKTWSCGALRRGLFGRSVGGGEAMHNQGPPVWALIPSDHQFTSLCKSSFLPAKSSSTMDQFP
jgi:hypothetical protein